MDHRGGTGGQDAILGFMVDEQFDLGFPLRSILDFIEQQGGRLAVGIGALMKKRQNFPERQQFQKGMIQAQVKDTSGIVSFLDQGMGHLLQHRGLAHPPRPGQEHGPAQTVSSR